MTDREIAQAAAKRWGQKDPCPGDIINQHIPKYGQDPTQRHRWHRIAEMTYSLATEPDRCEWCDKVLIGKTEGKRRYCDQSCCAKAHREREARRSA